MTIVICVQVDDGIALAADSASLITTGLDTGNLRHYLFDHASKIFQLSGSLPLGVAVADVGYLGRTSVAGIVAALRARLEGTDPDYPDWRLDGDTYTVEQVARRVHDYFYKEQYVPTYRDRIFLKPKLECVIAGYSARASAPETFRFAVDESGTTSGVQSVAPPRSAKLVYAGLTTPVARLIDGFDPVITLLLAENRNVEMAQVQGELDRVATQIMKAADIVIPVMPIGDAAEFAHFLVDTAIGYFRFNPNLRVIGGSPEVAVITRQDGFQWVRSHLRLSQGFGHGAS